MCECDEQLGRRGIEDEMRSTLQIICKKGCLIMHAHQIWWTWEVEDTSRRVSEGNKYAMKELESKLTGQLYTRSLATPFIIG